MLQGMCKPVNDLSCGVWLTHYRHTIALTGIQAAQADEQANQL